MAPETRRLIREMSQVNPLWGAPRIHGELLKLGIDVGQTTVAKYMPQYRRPPSQGWKTFITNHADGIASIDLMVVPTVTFRLLYALVILRHETCYPSALPLIRQRIGLPARSSRRFPGTRRPDT
jgi:hypothetical protein